MPRVLPRQPRFKPDEIVRSWQSFSFDDEQGSHVYRTGVRLRGDHPAVLRAPWCFVADDQPDDATPSLIPNVPEEPPRFSRPTKVRLKASLLFGPSRYEPGQIVELPAKVASWVVSENLGTEA